MKLRSIQMLRGVAALLVVVFHLHTVWGTMMVPQIAVDALPAAPIIENGYAGVDLFFVISGFIMVYVTGDRSRGVATAGAFLASRAARIYPPWWLFAGLFTVYMVLAHGVLNQSGLGWSAIGAGTVAPGEYLAKSFALVPQDIYPILNVGWTLIHEMYFYLVFAVTLLFARRWLPLFLGVWAALVTGLALAGYSDALGRDLLSLAVHPMTLEFILGAFAGLAVMSGRRWRPRLVVGVALGWLIAALVFTLPASVAEVEATAQLGGLAFIGHQVSFAGVGQWSLFMLEWGRVLAFGVPAALLVYGLAGLEAEGRIPIWKPMEAVGDWSYALYLSHILVIVAVARILSALEARLPLPDWLAFTTPNLVGGLVYAVLALAASIIVAWLTYRLFERPLVKGFNRWKAGAFAGRNITLRPAPLATRIW